MQADPTTGAANVDVILDRRVGAKPVLCQLPYADRICKEAFEEYDDHMCAVRQLAAVLKKNFADVYKDLSTIDEQLYGCSSMNTKGCTPRMVLEYCRQHGINCAIVHNDKLIEAYKSTGRQMVSFCVHEDHLYFYQDRHVCKNFLKWEAHIDSPKLQKESKNLEHTSIS